METGSTGEQPPMGMEAVRVELCSIPGVDSITGRSCILLDKHEKLCRVDTPFPDSDEWDEPRWQAYEAVFGRHLTPSE